jgi:glycosyltransferase involved in cell wall biosynthesis
MKIVFISDNFAEKMGYIENCLPKAIASLGHEVHIVASNVQHFSFFSPLYDQAYKPFIGPGVVACEEKNFDGYTLHRLPYGKWRGRPRIKGLVSKLLSLRPQIVQTLEAFNVTNYEAALARPFLDYKLFLEAHMHASVFPPATQWGGIKQRFKWLVYAATIGRLVSLLSEKCYAISADTADIAIQFFGIQSHKVNVSPLGVDTELFRSVSDEASQQVRSRLRQQLGFSDTDIICIYTGRFSKDKGPLYLAKAIASLVAQGEPVRGLFVGNGNEEEVQALKSCPGCVVHSFVPFRDLPPFYWAADLGVWPKQESTSQLDAASCGLPLILSNRVKVGERLHGNGLTYEEEDSENLARQIRLLFDAETRKRMGEYGSRKIREHFSWELIARQRVRDYEAALHAGG